MVLDPSKALLWKNYLGKAAKRLAERDVARERLEQQIDHLRKLSSPSVQEQIDELERRIQAALEREKQLRGHHEMEDMFHRKLRDRMLALETKINAYLSTRQERLKRIAELEDRVAGRLSDKSEKLEVLKMELYRLEQLARELEADPRGQKKITAITDKIQTLKKDVSAREAAA